jgi:hypothetical protein
VHLGKVHTRSYSSAEVLQHWRFVPCAIALRVTRLLWLQSMVADPVTHLQVVSAVFGKLAAEGAMTTSQDGVVLPTANPWAHELASDLGALGGLDDAATLMALIRVECDGTAERPPGFSFRLLLRHGNDEAKELFALIDVSQLRARYFQKTFHRSGS